MAEFRDRMIPALFGANNKLPLSYEQRLAALAERRKYANALRAQGLQPTEAGQMVSGHYVANPWAGLANVAKAYMGYKNMEDADTEEADLVKQRQADFEQAINDVPQDTPDVTMGGAPGEGEAPTTVAGKKATPQDWIKWGGNLSTLGPQGQAIGSAAINRAVETMLPKPLSTKVDWKDIEYADPETGQKRRGLYNPSDPSKIIPVGGAYAEKEHKDTQLEQRLAMSKRVTEIRRGALGRQLTPDEADEIDSLVMAMNQISAIPLGDGSYAMLDRTQGVPGAAARGPAPQAPGTPPSVQPNEVAPPNAGLVVSPAVQAERDRKALELKQAELDKATPGTPEHAALTTEVKQTIEAIRKNEAKAAPGQPAITGGAKPNEDAYAEYRKGGAQYDPRNEEYLTQPVGPGATVVRSGTGPQQRLNAAVEKLGKQVVEQKIDTFEDAWADFRKTFADARSKVAELRPSEDKRGMLERGWDKLRFGGGVGGPMGIYNSLPAFFNTPAGQDLKRAVERLKQFERHALFGATLTGNEKYSFEQGAGTLFGLEDAQLLNALGAMERQFNEKKATVFGSYAPIVVGEFRKARRTNTGQPAQPQPWLNRNKYGTGGVDG